MTGHCAPIRPADPGDLRRIRALLVGAGLPDTDVEAHVDSFLVYELESAVVGVGGLEVAGPEVLLRSVAVAAHCRGRGIGAALCNALESKARQRGNQALYLLTETAARLFAKRGYVNISRDQAPACIAGTRQFSELCPDSATLMRLELTPG